MGLFCAGLFGAIISTYNSLLNSAATIFMLDIYRPMINPGVAESELVKKAKIFGTVIAVFSIAIAPLLQSVGGIYNFGRATTGFYNMPIITLVLAGMFTTWATPLGVKLAICFHLVFYTVMKYVIGIDAPGNVTGIQISFIHVFAISVLIMFCIIYIAARVRPGVKAFDKTSVRVKNYDMRPWKYSKAVSIWLVSFLVYIYVMLSPLGLATEKKDMTLIGGMTVFVFALGAVLWLVARFSKETAKSDYETPETESELTEIAVQAKA